MLFVCCMFVCSHCPKSSVWDFSLLLLLDFILWRVWNGFWVVSAERGWQNAFFCHNVDQKCNFLGSHINCWELGGLLDHRMINNPDWRGSTRIIGSNCWSCTGQPTNPTISLRVLSMLPEMLNLGTGLALAVSCRDISREPKKNQRNVRTGHRKQLSCVCCVTITVFQARSRVRVNLGVELQCPSFPTEFQGWKVTTSFSFPPFQSM